MTQTNKDIVEAIFAASAEQDWATVKSYLHDRLTVHEADSLPYRGTFVGPDQFIELNAQVAATWEGTSTSVDHLLADGDHVVVLGTMNGTGKATGLAFQMPFAAVWRFEQGQVVEIRPYYFDTDLLRRVHGTSD